MLNLKVFMLVGVCVASTNAMSDEVKELMQSLHNTCITKIGIDESIVARAQKGDFADDENLRCYMKCCLDELGLIEEDGTIDAESMLGMLPDEYKEPLTPVIRKCAIIGGANACESAFSLHKCSFDTLPTMFFLP